MDLCTQEYGNSEKIVDISALSKEEREKYDASIKVYRDTLATMTYAEEKGMAEGIEKGLKEGATNIARKMRSMGLDIASICEAT